jgi:hypothetical protein
MNPSSGIDTMDDSWRSVFKIGGAAAVTVLALMPVQMVVYIVWPPPDTVTGWFTLLQDKPLVGLLDLDLLLLVDYILLGIVFVALWVKLREVDQSAMTIALFLETLAVASYFASTAAFEMLALSNHYAAAPTNAERAASMAAGHSMMATWEGTAFNTSYILSAIAFCWPRL